MFDHQYVCKGFTLLSAKNEMKQNETKHFDFVICKTNPLICETKVQDLVCQSIGFCLAKYKTPFRKLQNLVLQITESKLSLSVSLENEIFSNKVLKADKSWRK